MIGESHVRGSLRMTSKAPGRRGLTCQPLFLLNCRVVFARFVYLAEGFLREPLSLSRRALHLKHGAYTGSPVQLASAPLAFGRQSFRKSPYSPSLVSTPSGNSLRSGNFCRTACERQIKTEQGRRRRHRKCMHRMSQETRKSEYSSTPLACD